MTVAQQLVCLAPGTPTRLSLQTTPLSAPGRGQVLVQTLATCVNPIDVKRSAGYGRRLLGLKGAARFPLVLGNDLAGVVQAVGPGPTAWKPGDQVYGLIPTGPQGAHASHLNVDAKLLRPSPLDCAPEALAALPYTFTTLWLALQSIGLHQGNAPHKAVLVHGASGGLGQLALQVLVRWGARVTAVCGTAHVQRCRDLGALEVLDRHQQALSSLPPRFDASLNFAAWPDEAALISRLRPNAMGHATTVHPLLASFDEQGWVQGALQAYQAWSDMRKLALAKGPSTRYTWVVFRPSAPALDALHSLRPGTGLRLPIGLTAPLSQGQSAFSHVAQQRAGRAILIPQ
jgi:D-arabinose 1-dehydrogenase-like Zn-dependent alcohol dehydrogenase